MSLNQANIIGMNSLTINVQKLTVVVMFSVFLFDCIYLGIPASTKTNLFDVDLLSGNRNYPLAHAQVSEDQKNFTKTKLVYT
jgi:hypothetical protein